MSLDPVLKRHYINVPKPQSRPIPSSLTSTPPRSQTSFYTRSDLLSLSLTPLTAHHAPPIPASASRVDDVTRILAPPTVEKIEKVNQVLRKDSVEFLEGLVKQGKLDPTTPITAVSPPSAPAAQDVQVVRSRTLPIPLPAPVVVKKKNTLFPSSRQQPLIHHTQTQSGDEEGGWGEFGSMIPEDGSFDEADGKKPKEHQAVLLDFEIDSTLSPIDIELMSAKRLPSSSPVSIPIPPIRPQGAGGGASAVFNKSLGSATHGHGQGQYSPASPSPLSLSLAQSISKRHEGLRNLVSTSTSPSSIGIGKGQPSPGPGPGPTTARSPSVQSVIIVSSPIEDLLPWRKASLLSAKSTPIKPSPPVNSDPPKASTQASPATRKMIGSGSLNAFAPPFPLPQSTPSSISHATSRPAPVEGVARSESSTLPLPHPSSLPKKPTTILPPVFVKRELAMLPQTMALPDVPPMGDDWVGERSLSGNEKRRRASEFPSSVTSSSGWGQGSGVGLGVDLGMDGISRPGSSLSMTRSGSGLSIGHGGVGVGGGGSAPNSRRPQRLVSLGEKLKENINRAV